MKIAISSTGKTLDDSVDQRFGRCTYFLIIEIEDNEIKIQGLPVVPIDEKWLKGYTLLDDFRSKRENTEKAYWFDEEILNYFDRFGIGRFSKVNIWDIDWNKKARLLGRQGNFSDPRSGYEIWVHKFIEKHREDLFFGQAKKNLLFWLYYMFFRLGSRVFGW